MKFFKRALEWVKGKLGAKKEAVFDWDLNLPTKEEVEEGRRRIIRKKKRGRAHAVSAKLAELAVIAAAMLTCEMVYKGLYFELARSLGATLDNALMALSVAITLSMCIYIGFLKASKLSTTMDRTSAFVGGWVCIFLFCCWAVGTSSWYAFMSTTGIPALEMHLTGAPRRSTIALQATTAAKDASPVAIPWKPAVNVSTAPKAPAAATGARKGTTQHTTQVRARVESPAAARASPLCGLLAEPHSGLPESRTAACGALFERSEDLVEHCVCVGWCGYGEYGSHLSNLSGSQALSHRTGANAGVAARGQRAIAPGSARYCSGASGRSSRETEGAA